jgi:hypothetical protein
MATDSDRLIAAGVSLTLHRADDGEERTFTLRYRNRGLAMLEDHFGSLENAGDVLAALGKPVAVADFDLAKSQALDLAQRMAEAPEDDEQLHADLGLQWEQCWNRAYQAARASVGEQHIRIDTLVRFLTAALHGQEITEDQLLDDYDLRDFPQIVNAVSGALAQALPAARPRVVEEDPTTATTETTASPGVASSGSASALESALIASGT